MPRLFGILIVLWDLFFLPVVSAAALGALIFGTGLNQRLGPIGWAAMLPLIYLAWLILFLALSALEIQLTLRMFPKRRRLECRWDDGESMLAIRGIHLCYLRLIQLYTIPLFQTLQSIDYLRNLVFWSYAPSFHVGETVYMSGALIYDPDLIDIGDNAVIGGNAALVAHAMNVGQQGELIYISAPIKIGRRATVGGEARVALGVTIGEEAVVEPFSNVAPFTVIPAGEVWGGNPAVFRRKRSDVATALDQPPAQERPTPSAQIVVTGDAATLEVVRRVVADALNLPLERVSPELRAADCQAWDSLGQLTIAAMLYDRLGLRLSAEQVFSLRSVPDLVRLAEGRQPEGGAQVAAGQPAGPSAPRQGPATPARDPLPDNVELLPLLDREAAARALAERRGGVPIDQPTASLRVVVAATFTAEPLASSLKLWGRPFGIEVHPEFFGFNQVQRSLLAPNSPFRDNPTGMNVVLVRTEDLPAASEAECTAFVDQLLVAIEQFVRQSPGFSPLVVGTLPPPLSDFFHADRSWLDLVRARWRQRLAAMREVEIVDFSALVEEIGTAAAGNAELEVIARAPYALRLYQELGVALARIARKRRIAPAKVLAMDCDGVLWGGVIAEEGLEGIALGADGPQRSYQLFQQYARGLKDRGVLLVLVSRNDERDVWEVFDKHPGMILKREDIAAWRINWRPKSQNLHELAAELNLSPQAFVFVDDDPAVRLQVGADAPQVTVVPLPQDPARYGQTLARLWAFDGTATTAEDRSRTELIRLERQRDEHRETAGSHQSYLRDLELRVEMWLAEQRDLPRVAQLTQKTNQFNLSLRRRSLEEIKALGDGYLIYAVNASDRFGDYGLIGVGILKQPAADEVEVELDTFLLSCRALGRGVEQAFLHGLFQAARARGGVRLRAPYVEGPRNQPIRDFFAQSGFQEAEAGRFDAALDSGFPLPEHLQFSLRDAELAQRE